jgi:hypothetical protein
MEAFFVGLFAGMILSAGVSWLGGWLAVRVYDRTHPRSPAPRPPRES